MLGSVVVHLKAQACSGIDHNAFDLKALSESVEELLEHLAAAVDLGAGALRLVFEESAVELSPSLGVSVVSDLVSGFLASA